MDAETNKSGNSFIDDNHEGLLNKMDEITCLVRDKWDSLDFQPAINGFIIDLENHFSHEEAMLRGANYNKLDFHSLRHREISMKLRVKNLAPLDLDDAVTFLGELRSKIFSHELFEDQDYWPLFEDDEPTQGILIKWSRELKTGDKNADKHHKALMNHINRLHIRFSNSTDIESCCSELRQLYEYSKFHFSEEEHFLKEQFPPGHKENHESLIRDLDLLINEVKAGKFELSNIGDYLKYWLINHIKTFDIPLLKK